MPFDDRYSWSTGRYNLEGRRDQTAEGYWAGEDLVVRGRHRCLLASDTRRHRDQAEVDWPVVDGHIEVGDYDRNPEVDGRTVDAVPEEEDHNCLEEGRNYQEVVSCTGLGEGHSFPEEGHNFPGEDRNSLAEDHSCLAAAVEEDRHSFHSRSRTQDLGPEGNLRRLLDAARHRSVLGLDNQT